MINSRGDMCVSEHGLIVPCVSCIKLYIIPQKCVELLFVNQLKEIKIKKTTTSDPHPSRKSLVKEQAAVTGSDWIWHCLCLFPSGGTSWWKDAKSLSSFVFKDETKQL